MSEPISAFALYNSMPSVIKSKAKGKKSYQKNKAAKSGKIKVGSIVKKKENKNVKLRQKIKKNRSAVSDIKTSLKSLPNATTSKASKVNKQKMDNPKKGNRKSNGGIPLVETIDGVEFDELVEDLFCNSPSQLTSEQKKKKKEVEQFLVKQLEKDDLEQYDESDSSFTEEYSPTDSSSSTELEHSQTANDTTNHDSKDETEDFSIDANDSKLGVSFNLNELRKLSDRVSNSHSRRRRTTNRRSSTSAAAHETTNGETLPTTSAARVKSKQSATSTAQVQKNRQSLQPVVPVVISAEIKSEQLSPTSNILKMNSIAEGEKAFKWLISPMKIDQFFAKYWEQNPYLVKRNQENYFSHFFSFECIGEMLSKYHLEFTKNVDITSYINGVRETHNPEGRVYAPILWQHYSAGCSIRFLNPQTYLTSLSSYLVKLQEYFHCLVGINAYLTPPNSQGFAPHHDDIEAFVLQVEGRKHWKLYQPRECLPRFSSENMNENEIGKPFFDDVLLPGDVLYFPRGTIHQACTVPGYHSLHLTLSVYQKQSYADLFEIMVPMMLQSVIEKNKIMRDGLPLNIWRNAGVAFGPEQTEEREKINLEVGKRLKPLKSFNFAKVLDSAVDQLAKKYQREALPPELTRAELQCTIYGSRSTTNENGECLCDYDIDLCTNLRLLRANILRLIKEEGKVRVYYHVDNSRTYCEYEPNSFEIDPCEGGSIEVLIKAYPAYISVSQLPIEDDEAKISIATELWERGLLMLEKPI